MDTNIKSSVMSLFGSSAGDWRPTHCRPGSAGSDGSYWSTGADSDSTESYFSLSDEDAASILLSMSRTNTPFPTPSPPLPSVLVAADYLEYPTEAIKEFVSVEEPPTSPHRRNRRETRANKIVAKSGVSKPSLSRHNSLEGEIDLSTLTPAERHEVMKRPRRDQRKAKAIVGFRNNPQKYIQVTPRCARCEASDWQCFKRIPETENNKPGPARGWGRGCVSCHKSACSFASEDAE